MNARTSDYEHAYGVGLLDDLHNYFPAILYEPERFDSVQSLLLYFTEQTAHTMNLYTRHMRAHRRATGVPPPGSRGTFTTETIDITHLFPGPPAVMQTPLNLNSTASATQATTSLGSMLDLWTMLSNIRNLGTQAVQMDPVVVRPTQEQIDIATTLRQAHTEDELNSCAICQDAYTEGQAIRRITHCRHSFHRLCIDEWFAHNVKCPTCRFDIREHRAEPSTENA
jgi:hypothetical protein